MSFEYETISKESKMSLTPASRSISEAKFQLKSAHMCPEAFISVDSTL